MLIQFILLITVYNIQFCQLKADSLEKNCILHNLGSLLKPSIEFKLLIIPNSIKSIICMRKSEEYIFSMQYRASRVTDITLCVVFEGQLLKLNNKLLN